MALFSLSSLFSLSLLFLTTTITIIAKKQTYIVHTKPITTPLSLLNSLSSSPSSSPSTIYTYATAFSGFSASLTASQATSLLSSPHVIAVYPDTIYSLHTTRSPGFMGLGGLWEGRWPTQGNSVGDVIVGVLDTGVWPESMSFIDSGMSGVPDRWKGVCETGPDFKKGSCNRKLIGARSFSKGYRMSVSGESDVEIDSPRDYDGHGTHTASTAAGAHVANASLLGYATGTARGIAVDARVAVYKVCWKTGCFGSDILAGIEKAIEDGVDVLSMSLGGDSGPYYSDTIAIGTFSAMARGIFVSCSAGNSGPARSSVANSAPWIMTVGAGTLDRDFPAYVVLGNNKKFTGVSLYSGSGMGIEPVEVVYNVNGSSNMCLPGSLDPRLVKGKVVICDRGVNPRVEKGVVVRDAGGVGMILANTVASGGEELVADAHLVPAVAVGRRDGDRLREYVRTEKRPTAVLSFGGTVLGVKPSPVVAAFSSRGPNNLVAEILKPDVIGPGVNILAAWSEAVGPTGQDQDTRKTQFNIISGTSMSCPHISGLAALLKAVHPEWSPSAIKSALMTTAYTLDNTGLSLTDIADASPSTPLAHGSGHVDPHKAVFPGLVYDITTNDYIAFLCSLNYTYEHIQAIVQHSNFTCTKRLSSPGQLNYPSFSVSFGKTRLVRYTRTLTNVGAARSVYNVAVTGPPSVGVRVRPARLAFGEVGDKQTYTVTFVSRKIENGTSTEKNAFGSLSWNNIEHKVRSPITYAWQ